MAPANVVADRCDLLIAVWDGQPAQGLGGTGDVVRYAREIGREVLVVWPDPLCPPVVRDVDDEHFDATVTVLIENVMHHIEEEEQDWFPKVREGLGRNQLQEIGARMQQLRPDAPTTPSEPKALKKALDAICA